MSIAKHILSAVGGYEMERVGLNITWNRLCNTKGHARGNVSLDLANEHLNNDFKGVL